MDQELLLDLARKSADSVIHAAAPVTTFLVGYAAGLDAGTGQRRLQGLVRRGCCQSGRRRVPALRGRSRRRPGGKGWADTGPVAQSGRPAQQRWPAPLSGAGRHRMRAGLCTAYVDGGRHSGTGTGSSRTITALDTGVWLPSATLSSGTSTLASG